MPTNQPQEVNQKMNLCNIHFHKNAEHKGPEFSKYACTPATCAPRKLLRSRKKYAPASTAAWNRVIPLRFTMFTQPPRSNQVPLWVHASAN